MVIAVKDLSFATASLATFELHHRQESEWLSRGDYRKRVVSAASERFDCAESTLDPDNDHDGQDERARTEYYARRAGLSPSFTPARRTGRGDGGDTGM